MRTFREFIQKYQGIMHEALQIPIPVTEKPLQWPKSSDPLRVLIVSAHPDDEILTGMPLGLRYKEIGARVVNLAVTLGRPEQVEQRRSELTQACAYLDIELCIPLETGLRAHIISKDPALWNDAVEAIRTRIAEIRPQVIITHHGDDGHPDHCATYRLTLEAMQRIPGFSCMYITGEYWKDMPSPNLQLEVSAVHLEYLLNALSFHHGELKRNRYDLFWPPYMHLNRRYSEVIMGWGSHAAQFDFSVMYHVEQLYEGVVRRHALPIQCSMHDNILIMIPLPK